METKNREKFLSRAVINKLNVLSYLSNRLDENLRNVELFRIIRSNFSYRKNWSRDPAFIVPSKRGHEMSRATGGYNSASK